jgi:hypothetical protein
MRIKRRDHSPTIDRTSGGTAAAAAVSHRLRRPLQRRPWGRERPGRRRHTADAVLPYHPKLGELDAQ